MRHLRRLITIPIALIVLALAGLLTLAEVALAAVPPAPLITNKPAPVVRSSGASFMFERNVSGGTLECSLDGSAFVVCTSPRVYTVDEGAHTFAVRQVSAENEVGPETVASWTVDRTAPAAPTTLSGPSARTNATSATVTFALPEPGASVECSLDSAVGFAPCTDATSHTMSGLSHGAHTLYLSARDAVGNTSGMSFYTWRVDTEAPAPPTFVRHPDAETYDEVAVFLVQARDPYDTAGEECSLNGAEYVSCEAQVVAVGIGTHTLSARTKDAAGNVSAAATFKWTRVERPVVVPDPPVVPDPQPEPPVIVPDVPKVPENIQPPQLVCQPAISAAAPSAVMAGQAFAVTGWGFGANPGVIEVGGRAALVQSWTATEVIAVVAPGTPAGPTTLRVACAGGGQATHPFQVPRAKNLPPVAIGVALPTGAGKYKLDASNSYDPDGKICSYRWSLKGKVVSKKAVFTRSGLKPGAKYVFALTVRDCQGSSGKTKVTVRVKRKKAPVKLTFSGQALFAFDSCALSKSGASKVRSYSKYLKGAKSVTIGGHTDAIGSDAYNLQLSQCRAKSVQAQLLGKRKVKATVKGYGEGKPVAKNTTSAGADNPAGRAKNRRVEIVIKY